ncbi:MAG: type II toxin-antitoxin system RelE/ParE family toxin [Gammaproteobacteria bacterium]|nr:type II toxin-antitoxin system RelE/ParE family toxin [Gammaproteobacteria bacterium]
MQTVVELPEFQRKSSKLLSTDEKESIINYLATHPAAGDIMQGTGGIRKLRWSAQGKGKSGGVRVIYYHHNETIPLFLLTVFGKGEKANITKAEGKELAKLTAILVKSYGGGNK